MSVSSDHRPKARGRIDLSDDTASAGRISGRSARARRLTRTIVLGAVAVLCTIVWLARELGMDTAELLGYALTSLMLIGGLVLLAGLGATLLFLVKRLLR